MTGILDIVACSGPGAAIAITKSTAIGYWFAAATAYITIWLFRLRVRTGWDWPAYSGALLLVLHPAWTISASGDCGMMKVMFCYSSFLLICGVLIQQIVIARRYPKTG